MFGIGGSELVVIALVALLVFGPGRIPEVLRTISNGYKELAKLRRQVDDTVSGLKQDLNLNLNPFEAPRQMPGSRPSSLPVAKAPTPAAQGPPEKGSLDDYLAQQGKGAEPAVDVTPTEAASESDAPAAAGLPGDSAGTDDYLGDSNGR